MDKPYQRTAGVNNRQEKNAEKQRKLSRRLFSVLLFVVFIWAFLAFINSDLFIIETVEIQGMVHTTEQEIISALNLPPDANTWKINPGHFEHNVKTIPRIKNVNIKRDLPGGLVVMVEEKEALALVPYGEFFLEVCSDGQIIGTNQDPHNFGLPLLTGFIPSEVRVGQTILSADVMAGVAEAIEALNQAGINISELNLSDRDNLVLVTLDGMTVWLGNSEFAEKSSLLSQISGRFQGDRQSGYLDLRVKEMPVFSTAESP